jgi:hypothetical protein
MSAELPTELIVVGVFETKAQGTLHFTLHRYHGNDLVSQRPYYGKKDGNLKPGTD